MKNKGCLNTPAASAFIIAADSVPKKTRGHVTAEILLTPGDASIMGRADTVPNRCLRTA
jgi:hypothetical protein